MHLIRLTTVRTIMAKPLHKIIEDKFLEKATALGNSKTNFAKVAADLLNADAESVGKMAEGCFLSNATIARLMDEGGTDTYHPRADTVERVFKYFGAEVHFKKVRISTRWQNKSKV